MDRLLKFLDILYWGSVCMGVYAIELLSQRQLLCKKFHWLAWKVGNAFVTADKNIGAGTANTHLCVYWHSKLMLIDELQK
jgi:hypothetical protein